MTRLITFYKPFGVLCQFTAENPGDKTLADFRLPKDVYAAGRLDKDSEGLLVLTNDGKLQAQISNPKYQKEKTYWVQVERVPSNDSLKELQTGVVIKGNYKTKPCHVRIIEEPKLPERDPPIRYRKSVPTCWLEIIISEGKNRQVRRMTAAIGHPTLRLIRYSVDKWSLKELQPGEWREVEN